jgi:cytochrome c oxidase subunit 2
MVLAVAMFVAAGCGGSQDQSILSPGGPAATEIARLWWIMLAAFTVVFALVLVLLLMAVFSRPEIASASASDPGGDGDAPSTSARNHRLIFGGGVVLPVLVLTPLYVLSLHTSASLRQPREALTIRVVGHMWWWEVHYPSQGIVTANELHIPAGEPVRIELTSADVIHTFWVPRLNGKRDMIPGIETVTWLQAESPGTYRGQCSEYCGLQHANMALLVIAQERPDFDVWLAERAQPRVPPGTEAERRGYEIYMKSGCPQCHAVRGTPAKANAGPDLTHLASRRTLGAAMRANNRGTLAGWIADAQAIKPGIKMPRTYLDSGELMDLVLYLENLK